MEDAGSPLFAWAVGRFDDASAAAREHQADPDWAAAYDEGKSRETSEIVNVVGSE